MPKSDPRTSSPPSSGRSPQTSSAPFNAAPPRTASAPSSGRPPQTASAPTGAAPPRGDADLAAVGRLLGDAGRCRMLLALDDGRALPASRLADEAGVAPATASGHLGKLVDAGLLTVEARGRHRYFRLAGPEVGRLLETLGAFAPDTPVRSLRQGTRAHALRRGRTCYDHLAGRLGVALMGSLLDAGHLTGGDGTFDPDRADTDVRAGYGHDLDYRLTPSGDAFLAELGVVLPPRRKVVRYCVDWTEQRHHLSGGAGRGLRDRLVELDWIRSADATRAVVVTDTGREGLAATFGIEVDDDGWVGAPG